jgi:protein-tyrosine phosphatase
MKRKPIISAFVFALLLSCKQNTRHAENGESVKTKQWKASLEGQPNFRDLGGIVNKVGKKIKSGLIFRSGTLSKLTDQDISKIGPTPLIRTLS